MTVPPEAITAATDAVRGSYFSNQPFEFEAAARSALEAAAPLIAQAAQAELLADPATTTLVAGRMGEAIALGALQEHDRIIALARQHKPTYWEPAANEGKGGWVFFADLLRGDQP